MNTTDDHASGADTLSLARMLEMVSTDALPLRFTAYDGSATGPEAAEVGLTLRTPGVASYSATAPGDLGMARAGVGGDLVLGGAHPGDSAGVCKRLSTRIEMRRPPLKDVAATARSLGRGR